MATQNGTANSQNPVLNTRNSNVATGKPKRVRTGCLTCRERHLKCDEGLPICLNCRKSSRDCKRGVRLNFIDTQCEAPPVLAPNDDEWQLDFMDESRDVAEEYQDGLEKYSSLTLEPQPQEPPVTFDEDSMAFEFTSTAPPAPAMAHQALPSIQGMMPGTTQEEEIKPSAFFDNGREAQQQVPSIGAPDSGYSHHSAMSSHHSQYDAQNHHTNQQEDQSEIRDILNTQEETLYMQVFVEEVGIWMDSMDSMKHVRNALLRSVSYQC